MTAVWQDIIAFHTANNVTVTSGEPHLTSVTRCVWNYNGAYLILLIQHLPGSKTESVTQSFIFSSFMKI